MQAELLEVIQLDEMPTYDIPEGLVVEWEPTLAGIEGLHKTDIKRGKKFYTLPPGVTGKQITNITVQDHGLSQ